MFGSIQNIWLRQPNHYERQPFARATAQQQRYGAQNVSTSFYSDVNLHQTRLHLWPFGRAVWSGRSVGPFDPPEQEEEVQHMYFLFLENCFSRAAWNLFDVGNQSVPTHVASHIPFASFPVLF